MICCLRLGNQMSEAFEMMLVLLFILGINYYYIVSSSLASSLAAYTAIVVFYHLDTPYRLIAILYKMSSVDHYNTMRISNALI